MDINDKVLNKKSQNGCYLSLIIPAYNEQGRLSGSLQKIIDYFSTKKYAFEIIVVDDGSQDATTEIAERYIRTFAKGRLIKNESNRGKGYSVKRGIMSACGKFIFFSDADLSTPIEEIENLLSHLENGCDIVIGSRALIPSKVLVRQRWYRDMMGKVFGKLVRLLLVSGIADSQCGFKGFNRQAVQEIFPLQKLNGFSFDVEVLFIAKKLKFVIKEVPVRWINSYESKLNPLLDSIKMFLELLSIRWNDFRGRYDASK